MKISLREKSVLCVHLRKKDKREGNEKKSSTRRDINSLLTKHLFARYFSLRDSQKIGQRHWSSAGRYLFWSSLSTHVHSVEFLWKHQTQVLGMQKRLRGSGWSSNYDMGKMHKFRSLKITSLDLTWLQNKPQPPSSDPSSNRGIWSNIFDSPMNMARIFCE